MNKSERLMSNDAFSLCMYKVIIEHLSAETRLVSWQKISIFPFRLSVDQKRELIFILPSCLPRRGWSGAWSFGSGPSTWAGPSVVCTERGSWWSDPPRTSGSREIWLLCLLLRTPCLRWEKSSRQPFLFLQTYNYRYCLFGFLLNFVPKFYFNH